MPKKLELNLELSRENGSIALAIKIPEEFETFFKNLSQGKTQTSSYWFLDKERTKGCEFYLLNSSYIAIEKNLYSAFNDYGQGLIKNDKINLAPLRTLKVSQGITLYSKRFDEISNFALSFYVKQLGVFAKKIYEEMIAKKKITGRITFEI